VYTGGFLEFLNSIETREDRPLSVFQEVKTASGGGTLKEGIIWEELFLQKNMKS
jgi:hypothetical protein